MISLLTSLALAGPYEDGVAKLKARDPAAAEVLLAAATAERPDHVEAWWELGWAHWSQEDYAEAAQAWTKVESLNPAFPELSQWLPAARLRTQLSSTAGAQASVPTEAAGASVRFAAAGDTMLGSDLRKGAAGLAPGNGESIFADTRALFRAADIAFLNFEGTLADGLPSTKCGPGSTSCYAFRTPTRYTAALVDAGIDVVSMANNHAMDLGVPGMESGMKALDEAGIAHAGRYGDVAKLERNGVKVTVLAAHSGSCCLNVNRVDELTAAIRAADAEADLVVLSFHGGAEGSRARHVPGKTEVAWGEQRGDVKKLAHAAIDAGADLILGHGPHVLRGMEVYRERLIVYSMGNFVGYRQFGTKGGYGGTSVQVEAELAANGVLKAAKLHALALDSEGVPHPDPSGAAWKQIAELTAADFPEHGVTIGADGTLSW